MEVNCMENNCRITRDFITMGCDRKLRWRMLMLPAATVKRLNHVPLVKNW